MQKTEFGRTQTPLICIFTNRDGKLLDNPYPFDLSEAPPDMLEGVLSDNELYHFVHRLNMDPAALLKKNAG